MSRTSKTLAVLVWLNLICLLPHKTAAVTPELRSEFRDYNLNPTLTIQPQIAEELAYKASPLNLNNNFLNYFEWGNCTFFVASKINVGLLTGNANQWDNNAQAMGVYVSSTPAVGAIAQTDRGYWGHVAIVTQVQGDMVLLIEMNVVGLGAVDEHWYPAGDYKYIYF